MFLSYILNIVTVFIARFHIQFSYLRTKYQYNVCFRNKNKNMVLAFDNEDQLSFKLFQLRLDIKKKKKKKITESSCMVS